MNSDLIIMTFEDADEALKVSEAMQSMRKEPLLNLEQSVIVTRDRVGKVRLHQTRDFTENAAVVNSDFLGLLACLIFGNPTGIVWGMDISETRAELIQRGLDGKFINVIESAMGNNTSAILFWVRRDSGSDRDEVLNVLSLFKGKVHHTTISPKTEDYLVQVLGE